MVSCRAGDEITAGSAVAFDIERGAVCTAVAPAGNQIGQRGAIVVLRTTLNHLLQLEIDTVEAREPTRRVGLAPSS